MIQEEREGKRGCQCDVAADDILCVQRVFLLRLWCQWLSQGQNEDSCPLVTARLATALYDVDARMKYCIVLYAAASE